jgi:hypothetical protein
VGDGIVEMHSKFGLTTRGVRDHLDDLGFHGRVIFKWIVRK